MQGRVLWYDRAKGYGFIADLSSSKDYFVHRTALTERLHDDDFVTFKVGLYNGRDVAINIHVIDADAPAVRGVSNGNVL